LVRLLPICIFIFTGWNVIAQNTKGDRPVNNQRQIRETKSKSIKKKQRSSTRDVAGRRLRTKNKSSASRANSSFPQPNPYYDRPRQEEERAAEPRGRVFSQSPDESRTQGWRGDISGHRIKKIKPSKSGVARNNVYPQYGSYTHNPSRKPRDGKKSKNAKTATGKPVEKRQPPKYDDRAWTGDQEGKRIKIQSATPSIKNTYPQRGRYSPYYSKTPPKSKRPTYSNKRVPGKTRISTSTSGVVQSSAPFSRSGMFVKRGKKNVYWGKFRKGERAFQGDITGGPVRDRNFRTLPPGLVGRDTLNWFGRKPGGDRAYSGKRGRNIKVSPDQQRPWKNDIAGFKIRSPRKQKGDVAGEFFYPRKLSVTKSGEVGEFFFPRKLSVSGQLWNNNEKAIQSRQPKSDEMGDFSGNLKLKRAYKRNPNAVELALHKRDPKETVFDAGGLVVKHKQDKYGKKPYAVEDALRGKVISANGRKAGEFGGSLKLSQPYKKNPKSHELALRGRAPSKTSVNASEYSNSMKRNWDYKHNPSSDKDALKVRSPGKVFARVSDYQGNINGIQVCFGIF
jgi:hypothetical protein